MGKKVLKPKHIVLDTNVIVSALVFSKEPMAWLRQSWQRGDFVPLISKPVVAELLRVLNYPKFKLDKDDQQQLLADYLPYCKIISVPSELHANIQNVCRDPQDAMFITLAVVGHADAIISGDADLLSLKNYAEIPIVSLVEWKAKIPRR